MTTANILSQLGSPGVSTGFKNRIINGAMVISQRNGTSSITPTVDPTYNVDRWYTRNTAASKISVQQNAGSVTPPAGFTTYLGVTSLSAYSVGSTDFFAVEQRIEGYNVADLGWGTANAKTVTLSFWARSSLTGTFGGSIANASNARSYPFLYTISSANTWTYCSVTIPGDTTGTWETTNQTGIKVYHGLGVGSTYSGTAGAWASANYLSATGGVSVIGTLNATFYITGVQLEVGSSATGYEYRQYQQELALCQRYYYRQNASAIYSTMSVAVVEGSTYTSGSYLKLPVTMRATPTGSYSNISIWDGATRAVVTSLSSNWSTTDILGYTFVGSSGGLTVGRCAVVSANGTTSAWVDATAEL